MAKIAKKTKRYPPDLTAVERSANERIAILTSIPEGAGARAIRQAFRTAAPVNQRRAGFLCLRRGRDWPFRDPERTRSRGQGQAEACPASAQGLCRSSRTHRGSCRAGHPSRLRRAGKGSDRRGSIRTAGCRAAEVPGHRVVQALAPAHIIESGLPTERLLAYIAVSKYADGLPLYRQEAIYLRDGVSIWASNCRCSPTTSSSASRRAKGSLPMRRPCPRLPPVPGRPRKPGYGPMRAMIDRSAAPVRRWLPKVHIAPRSLLTSRSGVIGR